METVQADMDFRGSEFTVRVEVEEELLVVEILDLTTAEQWRGEFDPTCKYALQISLYRCDALSFIITLRITDQWVFCLTPPPHFNSDIEDLTRKTGNFKQFSIFCSMLESAVRRVRAPNFCHWF